MAILPTDIQLLESERMRDTADGGGRQTGNIIPSGLAGNVFPKVSRVDSVYGRVNLRKIYVAVRTATLDMYAGAHAIITDPPNNDRISCVLFSTGSSFDSRAQARDRIESYVVAGPFSRMRLYGNQLIGQKAILCYQREEEPLPDVGDVLVLSVEATGYAATSQYVRVTDVTHERRTFTDASGDFVRRIVTLKIGSSLGQTFPGAEVDRYSIDKSPTKVRVTQVADASHYYGIQPLVEETIAGALTLRIASVYAPLVPSTQRETAVSLAQIAGAQRLAAASGTTSSEIVASTTHQGANGNSWRTARAILPGTLLIDSAASGGIVYFHLADDGQGNIIQRNNGAVQGVVQYEDGICTYTVANGLAEGAGLVTATYTPAVEVAQPAHTRSIPITLATRGTIVAQTLAPLPAPGTVILDYRALGRWYRLRDDGHGVLVANNPSEGTGSVDYVTGALVVTLGALPDIDSAVLLAWGSPAHYSLLVPDAVSAAEITIEAPRLDDPITPGTLTLTWQVDGVIKTATDNGAGALTGDAPGTVDYAAPRITFAPPTMPDSATDIGIAYTKAPRTDAAAESNTFDAGAALLEFGVRANVTLALPNGSVGAGVLYDDGAGNLKLTPFSASPVLVGGDGYYIGGTVVLGTVDYTTGEIVVNATAAVSRQTWQNGAVPTWEYASAGTVAVTLGALSYVLAAGASPGEADINVPVGETPADMPLITIEPATPKALLPGSLMFTYGGKTYVDRNGTLYADIDPATGSGTAAGTVDYTTRAIRVTYAAEGATGVPVLKSALGVYGDWTATEAAFRTAGSPLRPASLYIQVTAADGELLAGTADTNGVISGPAMRGTVEQTMGVVAVEFGEEVGGDWVSREVMPGTLRYNCVVITNLPLDAAILGLDPVRLPQDGRVPIYRPGDVVVIHNTQTTALTNPVVAGATYSVGRTDLAVLRLEDANGDEIPSDRYVAALATGAVTIAADWSGVGVAQPLVAVHRIEDMALLADVQINGQIDLSAPTTHAYPVEGTYVSSALLYGDLQAIVTNVFDQGTWTNVWSDALIGSQSNAQYDDINHPIEVLNESAVTERWRVNFTSTTAFQIVGENLGVIATGSTAADCAPVNPVTGEAHFVIRAAGWGGGWSAGNQLRFNTIGATGPTWIARTILAGATLEGDSFDLEGRGDVD